MGKNKNKVNLPFVVMVSLLVMTGMGLKAFDWPQWRGPNREGVFTGASLNLDWTEKKPALLWTFRQAGAGYAAPTIVGTTLYCQGGADDDDFAFAMDTQTGNLKWKQTLGGLSVPERGDGPRGSVTVDGDRLYLVRGNGNFHCLSAADGKILWQKDFEKDFGGKVMSRWGFSESPLIDGNHVICSPGGSEGTVIALNKHTGDVVWRTKELTDAASHSSPIVADVDGIRQYIVFAAKNIAGIAAKDGKLLWSIAIEGEKVNAVIPTPVFIDNMLYVTNGYGFGCQCIKLTKDGDSVKAETIYKNRDLQNQHGGAVLMNGHIYGYSERPNDSWMCQHMKTGEIVWSQKGRDVEFGKGSMVAVNDRLLLLDMQTGSSALIAASPEGWQEFGRMEIPERTKIVTQDNHVWTHPVVAHDRLYIRDQDLLFCFDMRK